MVGKSLLNDVLLKRGMMYTNTYRMTAINKMREVLCKNVCLVSFISVWRNLNRKYSTSNNQRKMNNGAVMTDIDPPSP